MTTLGFVALLAAGVLAGLVGSAGGITSLVSYPALLAAGLSPFAANLANNVSLVACWPGSAAGSQPELRGRRAWLLRWSLVAVVGGAAGAVLLLSTSPGVFAHVVPFLVASGALALLFEPRLTAWRRRRAGAGSRFALPGLLCALTLYNGYFGAGAGVMTLALMLVFVDSHVPTANALKNMLIGSAQIVSAVIFALSGSVHWSAVLPLGVGMLIGSNLGPRITRRLSPALLRWLVGLLGIALAVQLLVNPGW